MTPKEVKKLADQTLEEVSNGYTEGTIEYIRSREQGNEFRRLALKEGCGRGLITSGGALLANCYNLDYELGKKLTFEFIEKLKAEGMKGS